MDEQWRLQVLERAVAELKCNSCRRCYLNDPDLEIMVQRCSHTICSRCAVDQPQECRACKPCPSQPNIDITLIEILEKAKRAEQELSGKNSQHKAILWALLAFSIVVVSLIVWQVAISTIRVSAYQSTLEIVDNGLENCTRLSLANAGRVLPRQKVGELHISLRSLTKFFNGIQYMDMSTVYLSQGSCGVRGNVLDSLSSDNFAAISTVEVNLDNNPIGDDAMLLLNNLAPCITKLVMSITDQGLLNMGSQFPSSLQELNMSSSLSYSDYNGITTLGLCQFASRLSVNAILPNLTIGLGMWVLTAVSNPVQQDLNGLLQRTLRCKLPADSPACNIYLRFQNGLVRGSSIFEC